MFGGGANTAWLQAEWLKDRRIGYWGDLDTWGLKFLADARLRQPHVEAVMMDRDTLIAHVERGVCEERPAELPDYGLTLAERSLFEELRSGRYGVADSTPFGHSAHADPDTCSTIIRTGSRSAATQGWHC
ncbi:DUF2220 domain-containing protein [Pseudomonas aeruginosa]|nr:DUF2220 domain-containing protein [Pseudomonas aeruginosa]